MSLVNTLYAGQRNCYRTNHLHMVVEEALPKDLSKMDRRQYGILMHEYVHYLQHITTLYGVKISSIFCQTQLLNREHLEDNHKIVLPLKLWQKNERFVEFYQHFIKVKGTDKDVFCERIELAPDAMKKARKERRAVDILAYDKEGNLIEYFNKERQPEPLKFGYWCVIESMAHMLQQMIDPSVGHADMPYRAVELLCKALHPTLADDKKSLIVLCQEALMFDNPGYHMVEMLLMMREDPEVKAMDIYKSILRDDVTFAGEKMPVKEMMSRTLFGFLKNIEAISGTVSQYYTKVLSNCRIEVDNEQSHFLEAILEKDITSFEEFQHLNEYYGFPLIETLTTTAPPLDEKGRPYLEVAALLGFEVVDYRLDLDSASDEGLKCLLYDHCSRTGAFEYECRDFQWLKSTTCAFKNAMHYYKLEDKEWEQEIIPYPIQVLKARKRPSTD